MSFNMILNSDSIFQYFPDNKPWHFKTKVNQTIDLNGIWKVASSERTLKEKTASTSTLYIYANVCGETIINGIEAPLLRRVVCKSN